MNTINNNLFVSKKSSIIFKGLSALVIMARSLFTR